MLSAARKPLALCLVLGFLALPLTHDRATSQTVSLGRVGDAVLTHDAEAGLAGFGLAINGASFQPLAGAAALGPDGNPDERIALDIEPRVVGNVLRVRVESSDHRARGVDPGEIQGLGPWTRLDLSRYAEPYGQTWWPKTLYSVKGDFWFSAHWVMEESNGSRWQAVSQQNRGQGRVPGALRVVYEPDTAGQVLPVHEVLELRVSRRLRDVVPAVRQKPSEYRAFLAGSVFIDFWGTRRAAELRHVLEIAKAISRGSLSYYTIVQNWQVGGWDARRTDPRGLDHHALGERQGCSVRRS